MTTLENVFQESTVSEPQLNKPPEVLEATQSQDTSNEIGKPASVAEIVKDPDAVGKAPILVSPQRSTIVLI